jgi:hypothetical protein
MKNSIQNGSERARKALIKELELENDIKEVS